MINIEYKCIEKKTAHLQESCRNITYNYKYMYHKYLDKNIKFRTFTRKRSLLVFDAVNILFISSSASFIFEITRF